jgi:molybdopterin-guanine dinucleotide biosynthesis protein A
MLQRVVRLVRSAVAPVVVVAAPGQRLPALPDDVRIARDEIAGRGPLQGIAAGLAAIDPSVEFVYATATDVPFLVPAWIRLLVARIGDNDVAIPFVQGFHNPLAALYRRAAVLREARALLAQNHLRPLFLMERLQTVVLDEDDLRSVDPELETIWNLNTPDDYERALQRAHLCVQ